MNGYSAGLWARSVGSASRLGRACPDDAPHSGSHLVLPGWGPTQLDPASHDLDPALCHLDQAACVWILLCMTLAHWTQTSAQAMLSGPQGSPRVQKFGRGKAAINAVTAPLLPNFWTSRSPVDCIAWRGWMRQFCAPYLACRPMFEHPFLRKDL